MPTKIREIIVEAKNPEFGFTLNLSIDLVQKKVLILEDQVADVRFPIFPMRKITRSDLQKQSAAINIINDLMDLYFGKDLKVDMFNGDLFRPEYTPTIPPVVPLINNGHILVCQQNLVDVEKCEKVKNKNETPGTSPIDWLPSNEPAKNSNGKYTRVCKFCGQTFETKRPQAMICGSKDCIREYNREYAKNKQKSNQQG